jgi:hypothetical protein
MKESLSINEPHEPGTIENPIVDSNLNLEEALRPNPEFSLSPEIFEKQILLPVIYKSFDGKFHQGQIVIDKDLEKDVIDFFHFLVEQNFVLNKVVPIADKKYNFNDKESMVDNNSSAFNPRLIAGTNRLSNHALGRAIDINPLQNPFIKNELIEPAGAVYDLQKPGTLTNLIVEFLKSKGWIWSGDYKEFKDYHHFEKPLKQI